MNVAATHGLAELGLQHLPQSRQRVSSRGVEFHEVDHHGGIDRVDLDRALSFAQLCCFYNQTEHGQDRFLGRPSRAYPSSFLL